VLAKTRDNRWRTCLHAAAEQDDEDAPPPEIQAAVNDMMGVISKLYDRMTVDVDLTERGIELRSSVILKD